MRPDRPSDALSIVVRFDQTVIAELVADIYRDDVAAAGFGSGRYGFALTGAAAALPPSGCLVTVEDRASGQVVLSGTAPPASVAGAGLRPDAPRVVQGFVDIVTFQQLKGWVWCPSEPLEALTVRVLADGRVIARAVANGHRPDVELAGFGTGRYGFDLTSDFKPPLTGCLITVEDHSTGTVLRNSPARLEGPLDLGGAAITAVTALFESPGDEDDLRARAAVAAGLAERLVQRLSDGRSRRTARVAQRALKWRWRDEDGLAPPHLSPRVLVIDHTMPAPGRDAGSHAVLSHMASLQRLGYEVLLVPADMRDGPGGRTLDDMGILYVTDPWCASVEEVMRREGPTFDLVYVHRYEPATRYVTLARHYMPQARRVYAVADLHGLRLARQGQIEERADLMAHAKFVYEAEVMAAAGCHAVVTHSVVEAEILRRALPRTAVEVVPWHVPVCATPASFHERSGIAFIGSYSHAPNHDAAVWLRDAVLPLVWEAAPDIVCTLAGTDMPPTLMEPFDARLRAVGRVDSISDLLGSVRMTVAPLAYGAGLKGKVVESMAMGVPCVCSTIAAEGFALPPSLQGLVAPDAAGLAASIVRLHRDPVLFAACREAGLAYVSEAFSEAVVDAGLRRAAGLASSPV